jgi:hypothetical protein
VWFGDVGGFVTERGEEGIVLAGEVGVECRGEGRGRDIVEECAGVALGSD